jgi:hypothetical protein
MESYVREDDVTMFIMPATSQIIFSESILNRFSIFVFVKIPPYLDHVWLGNNDEGLMNYVAHVPHIITGSCEIITYKAGTSVCPRDMRSLRSSPKSMVFGFGSSIVETCLQIDLHNRIMIEKKEKEFDELNKKIRNRIRKEVARRSYVVRNEHVYDWDCLSHNTVEFLFETDSSDWYYSSGPSTLLITGQTNKLVEGFDIIMSKRVRTFNSILLLSLLKGMLKDEIIKVCAYSVCQIDDYDPGQLLFRTASTFSYKRGISKMVRDQSTTHFDSRRIRLSRIKAAVSLIGEDSHHVQRVKNVLHSKILDISKQGGQILDVNKIAKQSSVRISSPRSTIKTTFKAA